MIPVLFAPGTTNFSTNGIGRLTDTTECIVHEQRNGCFEMTLTMPTSGRHFADIQKGLRYSFIVDTFFSWVYKLTIVYRLK